MKSCEREGNVLFATWYDGLAPLSEDAVLSVADFGRLLVLRDAVAKVLEPMRAEGRIGVGNQLLGVHLSLARRRPENIQRWWG